MSITEETRQEGFDHFMPKLRAIADTICACLEGSSVGMTANEIQAANPGISLNSVRSRLTELQIENFVEAFGKKVNPATGVRVAIWRVTKSPFL